MTVLRKMEFITPKWPVPNTVKAISTTRAFGESVGAYSSLNLGSHVGDSADTVQRNRASLRTILELPNEPLWLDQTHGNHVIDHARNADISGTDGVYTNQRGAVCAIMTADCLPLLFANETGDEVAAVHAGWRGLCNGVIENAIRRFRCAPEQVSAWVGPCIGSDAFEIGQEVKTQIGGPEEAYREANDAGKYFANLALLAQARLEQVGVHRFFNSNECTFSDPKRFFSYRRDGETGRMASLIWMESGKE